MPGLPHLPYLLKKNSHDLVGSLVAKEWLTLVKIGAFVFEGILTLAQMKCWNLHVKYLETLRQWEISESELTTMLQDMSQAHDLMYHLYKHVMIEGDKDANLDSKPNFHVGVHYEWYVRYILKMFYTCLCVRYILPTSCNHDRYIQEYGMPKWWDSERHENKHQDAIHDRRLTSGRADIYTQLSEKERRRKLCHFLLQRMRDYNDVSQTPPSVSAFGVHTYLKPQETLSPLFLEILADRYDVEACKLATRCKRYHTYRLGEQKWYRPEKVVCAL